MLLLLLLLLLRVCSVLKGSHAKAVNRRHVRGACCAVCVWRGHTHSRAQSTITFLAERSRLQQKQNSTQSTRVSMLQ